METEQPKTYHHHTPRQYLLAWADAHERIAWLGYGKVSRSGLTVVGGENDFYRLKELTVPDVDCLKLFDVPEKMELYYPLSPTQAMLYLEKSTPTGKFNNQVSIDDAHRYNQMMLDHSDLRVFSNSEEYLMFLKECAGVKKQLLDTVVCCHSVHSFAAGQSE